MRLWKLQSIGNDFPVLDLSEVDSDRLPELALQLCRRHFSVGGDGLLAIGKEGDSVRLRMFNPDGTEDFCGNGIRCAAKLAHHLGWVDTKFNIHHVDRIVGLYIDGEQISSAIGLAKYEPDAVPHRALGELFNTTIWSGMDAGMPLSLFGSALSTGSTHVVIPTQTLPDDETFRSVSARIENDPMYPQRTSVIWCKTEAENELRIRIWERGVGETLGCGTGSSAAAADYLRRQDRGGIVQVHNPGGTVQFAAASWRSPITITASAHIVFEGTISI